MRELDLESGNNIRGEVNAMMSAIVGGSISYGIFCDFKRLAQPSSNFLIVLYLAKGIE